MYFKDWAIFQSANIFIEIFIDFIRAENISFDAMPIYFINLNG